MMSAYVCRQCRAQYTGRIPLLRPPQWQPRATFSSLRTLQQQQQQQQQQRPPANPSHSASRPQPDEHRAPLVRPVFPKAAGPAQPQPQPQPTNAQQTAADEQAASGRARESYAPPVYEAICQGQLDTAWALFTDSYTRPDCLALTDPSHRDVQYLDRGKLFSDLSSTITETFCIGAPVPVSPTTVLFRYEQLGIARQDIWRATIAHLTNKLLLAISGSSRQIEDPELILYELLSLWRLFFQCKGRTDDALQSISPDWNSLPSTETPLTGRQPRNFPARLQAYHPRYPSDISIQFSAITIFNIFDQSQQDTFKPSDGLRKQALPFLRLLPHLLAGSNVSSALNYTSKIRGFKALPEAFQQQIVDQTERAPRQALIQIGSQSGSASAEGDGANDPSSNLEEFYRKRIARAALSEGHVGRLEQLWSEVQNVYMVKKTGKPAIPTRIYDDFLSYFMRFDTDRSVQIWQHMISHGVNPTLATWNGLLDGCARARDVNGLNSLWDRMLRAGLEPDNYSWATRIFGLFKARQINPGLAALDEMARRWRSAENAIRNPPSNSRNAKGRKKLPETAVTVNNCTKPSIEVVNGAISAIVQIPHSGMLHPRRVDAISKILAWAANFDIKPDHITYNSLIQLYVKAGDIQTTSKILKQMEAEGVKGDVATHTILMRVAFENQKFDSLDHSQQTDRVLALFNDFEKNGLKPNAHVYAISMDRLLKQYSNTEAIGRIMDYMQSRSFVPSAAMYTSLITHFFQCDPPDIDSVDALVTRIFSKLSSTDNILFDRIIEGYAANGEIGKMMSVLTRMSTHGQLPNWRALTALVRALVEANDYERARMVVRDVQKGEGVAKAGVLGGGQYQKEFSALVESVGLHQPLAGEVLQEDHAIRNPGSEAANVLREAEISEMAGKEEAQEVDEAASAKEGEGGEKVGEHGNIGGVPL